MNRQCVQVVLCAFLLATFGEEIIRGVSGGHIRGKIFRSGDASNGTSPIPVDDPQSNLTVDGGTGGDGGDGGNSTGNASSAGNDGSVSGGSGSGNNVSVSNNDGGDPVQTGGKGGDGGTGTGGTAKLGEDERHKGKGKHAKHAKHRHH